MPDPFDLFDPFEEETEEELPAEEEWVEISDGDGRKASLRYLATVCVDDRTYFVLGAESRDDSEKKALMLVREDKTADGASQYVIAGDENEIERVVARFVMHAISRHLEADIGISDEDDAVEACGCRHMPGEFCYCDDPLYLQ